jgi:hypothetical protein
VFRVKGSHRVSHYLVVRHHLTELSQYRLDVEYKGFLSSGGVDVELQRHTIYLYCAITHRIGCLLSTGDEIKATGVLTTELNEYFRVCADKNVHMYFS